ncbi:MAG TPA: phenylacetic acid degradation operon negative regulatory protein PaaX [Alphaproteobacteria bacterium]|nr:phenylacetic acid degradation operon negative regulatory protein PaaX [Alphaproteobacteria bacterium]
MSKGKRLDEIARELLSQTTPKAKSLIVTVFGDAIAPHGGTVWLGSLIALMAPFGVNERLVRTAVLRLSREDWLVSRQLGRRSYYSFTENGRRRFEDAHRRIYAAHRSPWTGEWLLVSTAADTLTPAERERLRTELAWLGFGALASGLFAHPSVDPEALRHVLQDLALVDRVVAMRARRDAITSEAALRNLVRRAWDLEALSRDYGDFLDRFRPAWHALEATPAETLDPAACFLIRVLLIHEYRRVLLRDPQLPEELLPGDWAGRAARLLCRNIYRRAALPAERHLMAIPEAAEGPFPEAASYFNDRFGGLAPGDALRETAAE